MLVLLIVHTEYLYWIADICRLEMISNQGVFGLGGGTTTDLSKDDLFDVLANQRRRFVVHLLKRAEAPTVTIGKLADQIAAWENDRSVREVTGNQRKRVYTSLQQSHLPKMDDIGLVEFNKSRGTVQPTEAFNDVDVYLDVVEGREIPWSEYYIGLSAVAAGLLAAVWIGAWPFVLLPEIAWTLAIVVAFMFSGLAHKYYTTHMKIGNRDEPPELT